jgi:hypothetical protein
MVNKLCLLILVCASNLVFGQGVSKIEIEAKPSDPTKGYAIELIKLNNEVKIYYKKVDSIAKFSFGEKDQLTMKRLVGKTGVYFDSLTMDSIAYFQHKVDSIRTANTYFKIDSTTIYKTSHPTYWRYLETILRTPNSILEKKMSDITSKNPTYGFFTLTQNNNERAVYIESLEPKVYPLLSKLVNDTIDIMKAHKLVMERKN